MIHRLHAIGRPSNRISQVLSSWNISRIEVESKQLPFSCLIGNSRPKSSLSSDTQEKKTLTFKQSMDNITHQNSFHHQRVWKAEESGEGKTHDYEEKINFQYWKDSIDKEENEGVANPRLGRALERIGEQEMEGGRMMNRQLGVIREDPSEDMRLLIQNYTVPALASSLRDREEILQLCATLLAKGELSTLAKTLRPFERKYVELRRQRKNNMDLTKKPGLDTPSLEMIRKGLARMPRQVSRPYQHRAGVVLPLCDVNGVPSILFEKRSRKLRAHPDEVCLPGGMVCDTNDQSIALTCLREMEEEIEGIDMNNVVVLGILRCHWGEVAQLTGVAVTPLVCYIGEIGDAHLKPNADEVSECFTVPLSIFLQRDRWIHQDNSAPIFTGGPHIIWGLTGYIVDRFIQDILIRFTIHLPS